MLTVIAEGHPDLADLLLLIAVILFAITAIIRAMAHTIDGTLTAAGLFAVALALLVL